MKSILEPTPAEVCFLCGRYGQLETHHIFGGNPNRKLSEKYGLKVHLCCRCHRDNKEGVHGNQKKMEQLHRIGQRTFEKNYSREKFMELFKRNYLDEEPGVTENMQNNMEGGSTDGIIWLE